MINATEKFAVVGTIDPDAYTAAAYLTDAIDLSKFDKVVFIVQAGVIVATGTVDFAVHGAATSGGSYGAISGTSITQLAATTDDDKQVIVELDSRTAMAAGYYWAKGSLTLTTAGADIGVIALGFNPQYGPATMYDLASVDEIVVA